MGTDVERPRRTTRLRGDEATIVVQHDPCPFCGTLKPFCGTDDQGRTYIHLDARWLR